MGGSFFKRPNVVFFLKEFLEDFPAAGIVIGITIAVWPAARIAFGSSSSLIGFFFGLVFGLVHLCIPRNRAKLETPSNGVAYVLGNALGTGLAYFLIWRLLPIIPR